MGWVERASQRDPNQPASLQRVWNWYCSASFRAGHYIFAPDSFKWWNWPQPPRWVPMLLEPGTEYGVLCGRKMACPGCHNVDIEAARLRNLRAQDQQARCAHQPCEERALSS